MGLIIVNAIQPTRDRTPIISTEDEQGSLVHLYLPITISMPGLVPFKVQVHMKWKENTEKRRRRSSTQGTPEPRAN